MRTRPKARVIPRTQQGPFFLEVIGRKRPGALYGYRQEWVESLARAAEATVWQKGG